MKRIRKIITLICTHLLFAGICLFAALWWFEKEAKYIFQQSNSMLSHMAIISRYSAMVDVQRENDYPDGYREALLGFAAALDEARGFNSPFSDEKTYYVDKTLTFQRLSLLERAVGDREKSEEYFSLAQANCKKAGWANCSPERLTEVVKKLEKNSLFSRGDKPSN